ncbi:MAG: amidoligase family protein [Ruminococcus bromii]|nr:amidoligase family protein [Ruminococcus bromii]
MKEHEIPCELCGEVYDPDELIPFDDRLICLECLENETTLCACCGQRIWLTDNAGNDNTPLCQTCYDQSYMTCSECGRLIHCEDSYYLDDSDEPLCLTCLEEANRDVIQGYYYKPEPIFYGIGPRYFGVELEIDEGGERGDYASQILTPANVGFTERLYCKHDGSLSNGFELVTHPMSLEYHQEEIPWPEVLHTARSLGYRSHQTQTCGLHVHVSRKAFGETEAEQEPAIARILYFVEKHWEELLKFSRRTPRQLERWAARYGYKDRPQEILEHAKKGSHAGRYSCVNLENRATIEFRMFRGTLKLNSLLATLQMVDHICSVALHLSDGACKDLSWRTFVTVPWLLTASGLSFLKKPVEVKTDEGDILRIDRHGKQKLQHFCINSFCPSCYSDAIEWYPKPLSAGRRNPDAYWEGLVSVAASFGYTPKDIHTLRECGFTSDEIEDFLYCGEI